ncbi:MAG: asparagine synthase C-terminal domain-containing protein, partial [Bacteroidota bacterium]
EYLSKMQTLDIQTFMVDDILTKVDRASMLNSLEARVPLLDHKVAELSFKIPVKFKYNQKGKKYILKKAMQSYLPDAVINHPKQGFTMPLKMWFKDSLRDYVNDRLRRSDSMIADYLDVNYISKTIDDHNNGMRDLNEKIWSLLVLDTWLEQQVKRDSTKIFATKTLKHHS